MEGILYRVVALRPEAASFIDRMGLNAFNGPANLFSLYRSRDGRAYLAILESWIDSFRNLLEGEKELYADQAGFSDRIEMVRFSETDVSNSVDCFCNGRRLIV